MAKVLAKRGIGRQLTREAIKAAAEQGQFTIVAIVDALTRLTQRVRYAGDRTELVHDANCPVFHHGIIE